MDDGQADLRLLYQVYSSQIEFSKTHLWSVLNYSMWAIAGTVGLYEGYKRFYKVLDPGKWVIVFPCMIIGICFLCVYNMFKSWLSMRTCRRQYREISGELSATFREMFRRAQVGGRLFACNYGSLGYDVWIVAPLIGAIVIGAWLAYVYVVSDIGVCSVRQLLISREFWWLGWTSVGFGGIWLVLLLRFLWRVEKKNKKWKKQKRERDREGTAEAAGVEEGEDVETVGSGSGF